MKQQPEVFEQPEDQLTECTWGSLQAPSMSSGVRYVRYAMPFGTIRPYAPSSVQNRIFAVHFTVTVPDTGESDVIVLTSRRVDSIRTRVRRVQPARQCCC